MAIPVKLMLPASHTSSAEGHRNWSTVEISAAHGEGNARHVEFSAWSSGHSDQHSVVSAVYTPGAGTFGDRVTKDSRRATV